jgi:GNAT superfamily N-acetyltransferase
LKLRVAAEDDLAAMEAIMHLAIEELQRDFLSAEAVSASHQVMGLDRQLVADGTYFIAEAECGSIAGCGGWSRRATLYGGDTGQVEREPRLLDPETEAARVRAMYTHPDFTRQGVGTLILEAAERAAAAEGFERVELMATLAGEPLYRARGYCELERLTDMVDGVDVPLIRMGKPVFAD